MSMDNQPFVSVLMSVWNAGKDLEGALESLRTQTYQNLEILIMDDASQDGSCLILETYQMMDSRFNIFSNASNRGLTKSLNELSRHASATLFARMDADDIAEPDRIEKQVSYLMQHPEVGVCGTQGWLVNEDAQKETPLNVPVGMISKKQLLFHNPCLHPSLVIRRSVFEEVGGYDEHMKKSQDYDLLLRLSRVTKIANIPERLIHYRFSSVSYLRYGKKQEWFAIRARWNAVTGGGYPVFVGLFWIMLRCLWLLVPQTVKYRKTYGYGKKT